MQYTTLTLAALAGVAQAIDVHVVSVGWNPVNNATGLKFWPEKVNAEPGSMVQFQFWAGAHTITQSNFDNVCQPMADGIDSDSMPVDASADTFEIPTYTVMVNDTNPVWLYCATGPHCADGMVMVINENTAGNATRSLENYKALAAGEPVDDSTGGGNGTDNAGGDAGNGGGVGGNIGGDDGSGLPGDDGGPPADGTPVEGDGAQSTGESDVPAAAASFGIPSTLLALGAVFMLL